MGLVIKKVISKSTGTKQIEPLFWFYKRSYSSVSTRCDFSDPFNLDGEITSATALVRDKDNNAVTEATEAQIELLPNIQSIRFILKNGSVDKSPYTIFARAVTNLNERSELKFEMRISEDSISESLDQPFEDLDDIFQDLDDPF